MLQQELQTALQPLSLTLTAFSFEGIESWTLQEGRSSVCTGMEVYVKSEISYCAHDAMLVEGTCRCLLNIDTESFSLSKKLTVKS